MNQFIIVTHATLAGGFADVVRFFKSDLENVQFINAYVESQEFEKEFRTALEILLAAYNAIFSPDVTIRTLSAYPSRIGAANPPHTTSPKTSYKTTSGL